MGQRGPPRRTRGSGAPRGRVAAARRRSPAAASRRAGPGCRSGPAASEGEGKGAARGAGEAAARAERCEAVESGAARGAGEAAARAERCEAVESGAARGAGEAAARGERCGRCGAAAGGEGAEHDTPPAARGGEAAALGTGARAAPKGALSRSGRRGVRPAVNRGRQSRGTSARRYVRSDAVCAAFLRMSSSWSSIQSPGSRAVTISFRPRRRRARSPGSIVRAA
jgi:hypothetical protein